MCYRLPLFLHKSHSLKNIPILLFCLAVGTWMSCTPPSGVFEKDLPLPSQQWESSFRPTFTFNISQTDTAYRYNVYIVLRHTDAYNYNNIWIRGTVREPGDTAARSQRYDLLLATNDKGWLASGMGPRRAVCIEGIIGVLAAAMFVLYKRRQQGLEANVDNKPILAG